jgi:hypothetical protein
MTRKPPSRWGLLWWFLTVIGQVFLAILIRLWGHWKILALAMAGATVWTLGYLLVKIAGGLRKRRLWIEDRRARGLKTYEQPRDAISNNEIVRRILFLPKRSPPQP